jgi:hypothetical protein
MRPYPRTMSRRDNACIYVRYLRANEEVVGRSEECSLDTNSVSIIVETKRDWNEKG